MGWKLVTGITLGLWSFYNYQNGNTGWKSNAGALLGLYMLYKSFFDRDKDCRPLPQPTYVGYGGYNDYYYDDDYEEYNNDYYHYESINTSPAITQKITPVLHKNNSLIKQPRIVILPKRWIPNWDKYVKESNEVSSYTMQSWPEIRYTLEGTDDNGKAINKIEMYSIPKEVLNILEKNLEITSKMTSQEKEAIKNFIIKFRKIPNVKLSYSNFTPYDAHEIYQIIAHDKLYIEEYESISKMKQYNLEGVTMQINRVKSECTLDVPGLAEKRPNILKNDVVYVRLQIEPRFQYSGLVKEVLKESIVIKGFDSRLLNYLSSTKEPALLDVRFTCSRYSFYIQHLAVDEMSLETLQTLCKEDLLKKLHNPYPTYPLPSYNPTSFPVPQTRTYNECLLRTLKAELGNPSFVNRNIKTNKEQQIAVLNILLRTSQSNAPYIIFGPPGTGKTATFVETILQVKNIICDSHILVCAQNNGTCDQIADKLYSSGVCDKEEIVRLVSSSRLEEVDRKISDITFALQGEDIYKIQKFRIIVCTLITAGRILEDNKYLNRRRNNRGRVLHTFTHLFIDEAGQATETETLVPIAGLLQPGGQVVLAGDPKQLGPVCAGKMSEKFGVCVSLLERLMSDSPNYQVKNGQYDSRFITQLVKNYRSHEDIIQVSNKLFYENKLQPQGINDELCFASLNKNSRNKKGGNNETGGSPIIFYGVEGQEERDPKSLSMWNKKEITIVVDYISQLFQCNIKNKVKQEDIGVIAPYFLQVQKIKQELRYRGWDNIETGSTETFQGREKRVIIVSTVRSQAKKVGYYPIGFVKDPRRFNVIMTRPQAKLIVIGNPHALSQDENWRYLIETVLKSGGYRGCEFKDLNSKFQNLNIDTPSTSTYRKKGRRKKN